MTATYLKKRQAIIPPGAVKVQDKRSSAVVYLYDSYSYVCALGFAGRKFKPSIWRRCYNNEERTRCVTAFFERTREDEKHLQARKAKQAGPHNLEVGHVFFTIWGYEQTNVNFYQVIELKGAKTVVLRELQKISEHRGNMAGTCTPAMGQFCAGSEPITRRVGADKRVKISEAQSGQLWDGQPLNWTAYH